MKFLELVSHVFDLNSLHQLKILWSQAVQAIIQSSYVKSKTVKKIRHGTLRYQGA